MSHIPDSVKGYIEKSGRFTDLKKLGSGSFGVVYKAYDKKYDVDVAIKVLTQAEGDALTRFRREFQTLVRIVHPNLVSLYEFCEENGLRYYTMEYVKGCDFKAHVRGETDKESPSYSEDKKGSSYLNAETLKDQEVDGWDSLAKTSSDALPAFRLNEELLRDALIQLAEGVRALHKANILHRDIKPANVMVTREEHQVMLLDFGLIHELVASGLDLSRSGFLVGTILYMSPEQTEGKKLTEATDWYSVGVMLYEVLTGTLPIFGSSRMEVMKKKISYEPPPPSAVVPGIPTDLDELCRDLLRIAPEARPTGNDVLRRLGRVPHDLPSPLSIPFVGRRKQLGTLSKALKAAKDNQTVIASVSGISGMGKSELVNHFVNRVERHERDVLVLKGRCLLQESVPYKSLSSLIDYLVRYLNKFYSVDQQAKLLPHDVSALVLLFDVFQELEALRQKRREVPEIPDQQELRRRAFSALREFFGRLARRNCLVIFIDDLQWGDVDSVALFSELLRPFDPPTSLLLIISYRSDEVETSSLATLLPALRAIPGTEFQEIEVKELNEIEALDLAQAVIGEGNEALATALAEIIAKESKGIPFFIDWFARDSDEDLITKNRVATGELLYSFSRVEGKELDRKILQRVARLPEAARRYLEILAVFGKPLESSDAMKAAELDGRTYRSITIKLEARRMIRAREIQDRSGFETYHDKFREAIINQLSPETLKEHHRRLASALESSRRADPETLAVHFREAGDQQRSAIYMEEAADQASKALAFDRAADLYQLAIDLHPKEAFDQHSLLRKRADALANAGRGSEAARVYLSVINERDAVEALELRRLAAEQFLRSGHIDEGLAEIRKVLGSMGMKLSETPRQALLSILARRAYARLKRLKYKERNEDQVPREVLVRIDTYWSVAVGLTMVDVIHGSDFQVRHLLLALKVGEPSRVARALAMEAAYAATAGVSSEAHVEKILASARKLSERLETQHPEALGRTMVASGIAAYLMNYWKKSVEVNMEAVKILRERCTGVDWERHLAQHFSLMSRVYLGEWDEIAGTLPGLLQEAQDRGDLLSVADLRTRLSYIPLLAADDLEALKGELEHVLDGWSLKGFTTQHFYDLLRRGEIALYQGDCATSWELVNKRWADLYGSLLMWQIQPFRIESQHLKARCALASAIKARSEGQDITQYLHTAEGAALKLKGEKSPFASALALFTQAGIAAVKGEREQSINLLRQSEGRFKAMDMSLYEAVASRRRGELVGGDEGLALLQGADKWMLDHGIKNPSRISNMMWPA